MSMRKPILLVGASVGVVAAAFAIRKLLKNPQVYARLFGHLEVRARKDHDDWIIDLNSENSFPASDPPSFSPCSMR